MEKETKFGYGFLLVGCAVPYLADKLIGPIAALIVAAVVLVVGLLFLIAAHHDRNMRVPRSLAMTIWLFAVYGAGIGALGGSITGAIWKIANNKTSPIQAPPASLANSAQSHTPEPEGTTPRVNGKTSLPAPTADEIATAIADKTRIRELFQQDRDKPIIGMYVIFSLSKPLPMNQLRDAAAILEIVDYIDESKPGLFFGTHYDTKEWQLLGPDGNRPILMEGTRCKIWTYPRMASPSSTNNIIDDFLVYRFDSMDRLEDGAVISNTPFSKVGDLDHAVALLKATKSIVEFIDKVTLVVNDYVVFEIRKADVAKWYSPMPPMNFQVTHGEMDPSGKLANQTVVASAPIPVNPGMPDDFKKYSFFAASFSAKFATAPFDQAANLKLSDIDVRIHHVLGGEMDHKAGHGELMVPLGEHGWLPKETQ